MVKTIKISDENYQELVKMAGALQSTAGKPVPIDGAVAFLLRNKAVFEAAMLHTESMAEVRQEAKSEIKERWKTWGSKIFLKKEKEKTEKAKADQKSAENI